jgi:hypothetical protein
MGIAFMAALVLIYGLIVWEFRDFAIAGLIMSPIPCTMIGIVPGHWLLGAEFTATSMIGMIALGGIIVRQSILIVEFVKIEVAKGRPVREAAVAGAEIRMRPILITSLTLMAGAYAIIFDPIFQGMAVSLLFGAGVATLMAVIIIPLGCISLRKRFYLETDMDSGELELSPDFERIEGEAIEAADDVVEEYKTPLWMRIYAGIISLFSWIFLILRSVFIMLKMLVGGILSKFGKSDEPPPPSSTPPSSPPSGPAPTAPDSTPAASEQNKTEKAAPKKKTKKAAPRKAEPKKAEAKKPKKSEARKATPEKAAEVKKAPVKKAAQETAPVPSAELVAQKPAPAAKKAAAKKTTAKKTESKTSTPEKAPVKKAPVRKTAPKGRRGIRLKIEDE